MRERFVGRMGVNRGGKEVESQNDPYAFCRSAKLSKTNLNNKKIVNPTYTPSVTFSNLYERQKKKKDYINDKSSLQWV